MASDKLLYLGAFRSIFGTLIVTCFGAILLTFRHSVMLVGIGVVNPRAAESLFVLDLSTIFDILLGRGGAFLGVSMTQLDTWQKLEEQIAKSTKT